MRTIDIQTSHPYKAMIGTGLLDDCGMLIREHANIHPNAAIAAIITDDKVGPLYAEKVEKSLKAAGFDTVCFMIPNGEISKNIHSYAAIMEFLADKHVTRSDFIVALGGGVVGDLAGFAAATFLRKIDFIQIPTTLLAAVDSSVGGKTGVDLEAGKNLVGAFHQPKLVICDLDTLNTLEPDVFTEGCAEVIKAGILADEELFAHLAAQGQSFDREYTVAKCIEMKRDVVTKDEFDNGLRQLLNLGHTLAHAVEMLSDFSMYHGMAVAIGMAVVTRAAAKQGICSAECRDQILSVLEKFGLPTETQFSMDEMYKVMLSDKKRKGSSISLVIPERIGACQIKKMPLEEMRAFMESGL